MGLYQLPYSDIDTYAHVSYSSMLRTIKAFIDSSLLRASI